MALELGTPMTDDAKRIWQWEQVCKLRTMERDAALSALSVSEKRAEDWKDAALGFQAVLKETRAERDSSQASLLRAEGCLREVIKFQISEVLDRHDSKTADVAKEWLALKKLARTALSPHTEK